MSYLLKKRGALKKPLLFFLQRLASVANRMIQNPEARQIKIESLTFENVSSQCKRVIRPLKARLAPIVEWT